MGFLSFATTRLFPILALFRILNTFLVQTYFNPDEYWQGPEVAHRMIFGKGHLTWEWSPLAQLRSAVHPSMFAVFYYVVQKLDLDSRFVIAYGPRILQSIFAAVGDLYVYKWSLKLFRSKKIGLWSLFCSCISFFNFFCITRTFSNSAETIMTIIALYHWPISSNISNNILTKKNDDFLLLQNDKHNINRQHSNSWWLALISAAIAVTLRPTSVLIWLPLGLRSLWVLKTCKLRLTLIAYVLIISIGTIIIWLMIDYYFYNQITFVLWNFISFNFVNGLDKLYGSHPWHWYLSQGCWVVFGTSLPLCLFSMLFILTSSLSPSTTTITTTTTRSTLIIDWSRKKLQTMTISMIWVIAVVIVALSSTAHKEFRFILPLLPIINVWSGFALDCIATIMTGTGDNSNNTIPNEFDDNYDKCKNKEKKNKIRSLRAREGVRDSPFYLFFQSKCSNRSNLFKLFVFLLSLINITVAVVLSLVHQRGAIDVINYLATVEDIPNHPVTSIHFWTPCHATPYTSYFHRRHGKSIQTKQLDCSPPTMRSNWCGASVCNSLKVGIFPNHGLSQSSSFENYPMKTLSYLYKDISDNALSNNHKENVPEFDQFGKIVVQWNWMYNSKNIPSHIVIFDSEETNDVVHFLKNKMKCKRVIDFFHSFAQGDMHASRMRSRIALWRCGVD